MKRDMTVDEMYDLISDADPIEVENALKAVIDADPLGLDNLEEPTRIHHISRAEEEADIFDEEHEDSMF